MIPFAYTCLYVCVGGGGGGVRGHGVSRVSCELWYLIEGKGGGGSAQKLIMVCETLLGVERQGPPPPPP